MPQIHLRAEEGDYAPLVLLPGDPNRARRISERFDEGSARQVNEHRGMLGFTGTYHGTPVSVQTSGMGTPSLSIVVEELLRLGAKRFIRVGTCGGIAKGLATGDLVIATAACPTDGATATYLHGEPYAPAADFALTRSLVDAAAAAGVQARTGLIASVDVFYNTDDDYAQRWRDRGVLAFEMEASALFFLAARAGVQAACALIVSDVLGDDVTTRGELPAARRAGSGDRPHDRRRPGRRDRDLGRHRSCGRLEGHDRHASTRRGQPGWRDHQPERGRRGAGLPAAEGHRPRRVLGRQREAGRALLPRAVGLHAGGLRGARDGRARSVQLRDGPERHPVRVHRTDLARRRDRRARGEARRRREGHRLRGRRRRVGLGGDDEAGRAIGPGADDARGQEGRPPQEQHPHLRRGRPLVRRPLRLSRRVRPRLPPHHEPGDPRRAARACSRSTIASATSGSAT